MAESKKITGLAGRSLGKETAKEMNHWYEQLFENYANNYEKEDFTRGTKKNRANYMLKKSGWFWILIFI